MEKQMIISTAQTLIRNHRFSKRRGRGHCYARVLQPKSRENFPCKTISDPDELIKLGYTPSSKLMTSKTPANDYEVLKKVA
tara:strand:- start:734 stop:976 length:243 start_codon:yes stop_codon:yes gene_type:complete